MTTQETLEILARIFTSAELTSIENDIADASFLSRKEGFNATAEVQWRYREFFRKASQIAKENGNEKMDGTRYRF